MNATYWIDHLHLQPHPEGGFYSETYRSGVTSAPSGFDGERSFSTAIYFLLRQQDRSVFHRIKSDEVWHRYAGGSLTLYVLDTRGLTTYVLGDQLERGERPQVVIPAGSWFGALVNEPHAYVLSGCTVSPGFDFRDFEMADRQTLIGQYPEHARIITRLT